jgi:TRAP transporter TAXI family solute receptor
MTAANITLQKRALLLSYCASAALLIFLTWLAVPKLHLTIRSGPKGGTYYAIAKTYQSFLEKKGYRVDVQPSDKTEEIVDEVDDRSSDFDIGFIAQDLRGKKLNNVVSLGEIQIQPIFVFSKRSAYAQEVRSFSDLKGKNLVLPTEQSVTSQAVLKIFSSFNIDQNNTKITFLPLGDAVSQLKNGNFDTGLFMLSADNAKVVDLATNHNLTLNTMADIEAIAKKFPFLRRASLPSGIYDLEKNIPATDTPLIAANISLIVKKDLPPATIYALLEVMSQTHHPGSYVSAPGEFPSYVGTDLPIHPLVADFHRSGTPWIFSNLPISFASIVDKYLVAFLALWFLVGLRRGVEDINGLRKFILETVFKIILRQIHRSVERGKSLSARDAWIVKKISHWAERDEESSNLKILIAHLGIKQKEKGFSVGEEHAS